MSGLFSSTPGSFAARCPDDEEELSRLRADLFAEGSPSLLKEDEDDLDAKPEAVVPHRLTDAPLATEVLGRKPIFDDANSYRVAQVRSNSASDAQPIVQPTSTSKPAQSAGKAASIPNDPTKGWKPQAVVDAAVQALREDGETPDPLFVGFMWQLLEREGGYKPETPGDAKHSPDPETNRGVTDLTRKNRQGKDETPNLPNSVIELTPRNYYDIYRQYLRESKAELLHQFSDLQKQAPRLAEFIFDSQVQHGPGHAVQWLQEALNRVVLQSDILGDNNDGTVQRIKAAMRTVHDKDGVPSERKIEESVGKYLFSGKDGIPQLKIDGGLGPLTLAVVKLALEEGLMTSVGNQMVLDRAAFLGVENPGQKKGNLDRLQPFLSGRP